MCSEWKMASSSSSSSSRRKKQEVALARTDHYEDKEVESSMLQARGLGAVTQGIYKIFGFTTGSEDYRETPEDIFDEGKEDNEDTDEIINDAYQKELLEATNKSANSQANEIAAIIENNVVENTFKRQSKGFAPKTRYFWVGISCNIVESNVQIEVYR